VRVLVSASGLREMTLYQRITLGPEGERARSGARRARHKGEPLLARASTGKLSGKLARASKALPRQVVSQACPGKV
jgi:hypothetical protein